MDETFGELRAFWPVTVARIEQNVGATRRAVEGLAAQAQEEMRAQAPWYPVGPGTKWYQSTGAARESLTADVRSYRGRRGRTWRIELYYDDEVLERLNPEEYERVGNYGAFLEDANAGRYAIVQPTAISLRQQLGRELRRIWNGNLDVAPGTPGRFRYAPPSTRAGGR